MDLATVIAGQLTQAGGPVPVLMGMASLDYHGVTLLNLARPFRTRAVSFLSRTKQGQ